MKARKPFYEVLQTMHSERYLRMGFLYHIMESAKNQIREVDPKHAQEYINIIEQWWDYLMGTSSSTDPDAPQIPIQYRFQCRSST